MHQITPHYWKPCGTDCNKVLRLSSTFGDTVILSPLGLLGSEDIGGPGFFVWKINELYRNKLIDLVCDLCQAQLVSGKKLFSDFCSSDNSGSYRHALYAWHNIGCYCFCKFDGLIGGGESIGGKLIPVDKVLLLYMVLVDESLVWDWVPFLLGALPHQPAAQQVQGQH